MFGFHVFHVNRVLQKALAAQNKMWASWCPRGGDTKFRASKTVSQWIDSGKWSLSKI